MNEPPVTVHLPRYNQIAYVDQAIGSAVEQDYDNLEVLCGDNGSTDGTADRIQEWAARYPGRVVAVLGPHVGMTGNCNRLFQRFRGEYVFGHAGDDVFLPGKDQKTGGVWGSSDRMTAGIQRCFVIRTSSIPAAGGSFLQRQSTRLDRLRCRRVDRV